MNNYMEWATRDAPDLNLISRMAGLELDFYIKTRSFLGEGKYFHSMQVTRGFEYTWVFERLPKGQRRVLDAGGGASPMQLIVSLYNEEVYNIDNDEKAMEKLKLQLLEMRKWGQYNNVYLVCDDISSIPFHDSYFDNSYSISVLEHTKKALIIDKIKELQRVTKNKVFITADITLEKEGKLDPYVRDFKLDLKKMKEIAETFDFEVPDIPKNHLYFECEEHNNRINHFVIACISLSSEETITTHPSVSIGSEAKKP